MTNAAQSSACPPVLLLAFCRPRETAAVLQALSHVRPGRVYVAVDGPRAGRPGEAEAVGAVRGLVRSIGWECEIKTRFRDDNLGCRRAVVDALDWFFAHENAGVILEDDCVPDASFFRYAAELLDRFANEPRVMMISGNNFTPWVRGPDASYRFSRYAHIWGWATWRRAWREYDDAMSGWGAPDALQALSAVVGRRQVAGYWAPVLSAVARGEIDSWAYRWTYTLMRRGGLCATPRKNLVRNIGFGDAATHTTRAGTLADLSTESLAFPLRHNFRLEVCEAADRAFEDEFLVPTFTRRVLRRLGVAPGRMVWHTAT